MWFKTERAGTRAVDQHGCTWQHSAFYPYICTDGTALSMMRGSPAGTDAEWRQPTSREAERERDAQDLGNARELLHEFYEFELASRGVVVACDVVQQAGEPASAFQARMLAHLHHLSWQTLQADVQELQCASARPPLDDQSLENLMLRQCERFVRWLRLIGIDPGIMGMLTGVDAAHGRHGCTKHEHRAGASAALLQFVFASPVPGGADAAAADGADSDDSSSSSDSSSSDGGGGGSPQPTRCRNYSEGGVGRCRYRGTRAYSKSMGAYRHACGTTAHKAHQERRMRGPVQSALARVPAHALAPQGAQAWLQGKLVARQAVHACLGGTWEAEARFSKFVNKKKEFHRIAQGMSWGFHTVQSRFSHALDGDVRWSHHVQHTLGRCKPWGCIVGFGDASTGQGGCISRPQTAHVVSLCGFLRREYCGARRHNMCLVMIDEHMTSQVCSDCLCTGVKRVRMGEGRGRGKPVECTARCAERGGRKIMDRDINAARNMLRILLALLMGLDPTRELHEQLRAVFSRQVGSCVMHMAAAAAVD